MPQNRGKEHQTEEQLQNNEDILALGARLGQIPDGGQSQGTPVIALQILLDDVRRLRVVVDPVARSEAIVLVDDVVETAVPVEYHKQVMDQGRAPEQIGVVGVALGPVHEGPEAVDLHQPEAAQDRVEADGQVEEVQRQQAQAVDVEDRRVHVMGAQLQCVRLKHPVLQIAGAEVKEYIDQI